MLWKTLWVAEMSKHRVLQMKTNPIQVPHKAAHPLRPKKYIHLIYYLHCFALKEENMVLNWTWTWTSNEYNAAVHRKQMNMSCQPHHRETCINSQYDMEPILYTTAWFDLILECQNAGNATLFILNNMFSIFLPWVHLY